MSDGKPNTPHKARSTKTRKPPAALKTLAERAERQTKRVAVSILEVLAGRRSPTEASEALGVSLTRYYALEARALEGLVEACKPRSKGPRRDPAREIAKLERELRRLERECARNQALLRVAQRAVGLTSQARPEPRKSGKASSKSKSGARRRRRKPVARALRVAEVLSEESENGAASSAPGGEKCVASKTPPRDNPSPGEKNVN